MNPKILATIFISSSFLVGCGGGDGGDQYSTSPEDTVEQNNLGWKKTTNTSGTTEDLVNDITRVVFSHTVDVPFIDTVLLNASDIVTNDAECSDGGSYSYSSNVIQLNNCKGWFSAYTANGRIDVASNGTVYTFKDFELASSNGEALFLNGTAKLKLTDTAASFSTDELDIDTLQLVASNQFDNVLYEITNYSSQWKSVSSRATSIATKGRIASAGNDEGDFNVSYDGTRAPFIFDVSDDNVESYYPYTGGLSIQDRSNAKNWITIVANNDEASFQYKAVENDKVLINKNALWVAFSE